MKRHIISATAVIIAILLSGCAVFSNTNTNNTKIDLGNSETYTDTELQAAADMIIAQIKEWNSVDEIRTVSYSGDIISAENLEYCNTLNNGVYDQCVVFESAFSLPVRQIQWDLNRIHFMTAGCGILQEPTAARGKW